MPKELTKRKTRCLEWMHCPSPTSPPSASDNKGNGGSDVEDRRGGGDPAIVAALPGIGMGLAGGEEDANEEIVGPY